MTTPFDPGSYLDDAESQAELLETAIATGDDEVIANVRAIITRAAATMAERDQ